MTFFDVTMSHPADPEWDTHLRAHVDYLRGLVEQGKVRAAGRATELPLRSGLIVLHVTDRAELDQLIADDPFARAGIIAELSITEWDPLFLALRRTRPDTCPNSTDRFSSTSATPSEVVPLG